MGAKQFVTSMSRINNYKARFIEECERAEQNKEPAAREHDDGDHDRRSSKKTKFAKSEKSAPRSGHKTETESGPKYCTHCKTDTHNTEHCALCHWCGHVK
jgi:hypothetical protein